MDTQKTIFNLSLLTLFPFLLMACATPANVIGTDDVSQDTSTHKKKTVAELGQFSFDNRETIRQNIDALSRQLMRNSNRKVLITTRTKTIEKHPVLKLVDRDGDGGPDQFVYIQKDTTNWNTPDYGFIYDLNSDGRIDYIVFNQGTLLAKNKSNPFKFVHTLYHWIDSNNDGVIDIWIYPDIDLDEDGMVDNDIYGWLYDTNGDGLVDSGEYIGPTIKQAIDIEGGVVNIERFGHETMASINKNLFMIQELSNKILADINFNIE